MLLRGVLPEFAALIVDAFWRRAKADEAAERQGRGTARRAAAPSSVPMTTAA